MKHLVPFLFSIVLVVSDEVAPWDLSQLQIFVLIAMFVTAFFQEFRVALPHGIVLLAWFLWRHGFLPADFVFIVLSLGILCMTSKFRRDQEKLTRELKADQHFRALGRLSAMLAHEIRNPLTALSGSIEYLEQSSGELTAENKKLFQISKKEISRLQNLVTDFLDFSKSSPTKMTAINLSKLTRDWIQFSQLQRQTMPAMEIDIEDDVVIQGAEDRLQQAFLNLLQNAREATPTDKEAPISVSLKRATGGVAAVLTIQDRGRGIESHRIDQLFEPFQTTKVKGTGLGLAITKRILDAHGAVISVHSKLHEGTTFQIQFLKT